jgi:hypothetical protein
MARGHFATSLYASMSRSQLDFGGPSTFGLEVTRFPYAYDSERGAITQGKNVFGAKNGSSFRLGSMIDRGCFNYRWPVTDYYLDLHPYQKLVKKKRKELWWLKARGKIEDSEEEETDAEDKDELEQQCGSQSEHVGTCQMFSCAMGKMFYQVLRIEELRADRGFEMSFPTDSQIVLTVGGPVCKWWGRIPFPILSNLFIFFLKDNISILPEQLLTPLLSRVSVI